MSAEPWGVVNLVEQEAEWALEDVFLASNDDQKELLIASSLGEPDRI